MRLILHADATPEIGAGHVMRCASLAEAWLQGKYGPVEHHGNVSIAFARHRLLQAGIDPHQPPSNDPVAVVVVDTYDTAARHRLATAPAAVRVLIDDVGAPGTEGFDVIWNPNAYPSAHLYPAFPGTIISELVPVRTGLPRWHSLGSSVAVTLGGSSPPNWIVQAIDGWAKQRAVSLVTGAARWVPADWTTVSTDDQWSAFSRCAMMISAAGSTVWEAANVGIPACVLITAPNQALVGNWVAEHGGSVIDTIRSSDIKALSAELERFTAAAAPLPRVEPGAATVARMLRELH